jgi:exopolysaccharide biosynthesis predicted pyruvyltransferase EpsI
MGNTLFYIISYLKLQFRILFCFNKKTFVVCYPTHPNLGDQAQLMCTDIWLKKNYPDYTIFHLGYFTPTINLCSVHRNFTHALFYLTSWLILKLKVGKNDFFIGHSGYFMIDHHNGWKMFVEIMRMFPNNRLIIFPQTINFYEPVVRQIVKREFAKATNVTLLCRDYVSHQKAKELFPDTHLLLFPDIVTSLIGVKRYTKNREGILFCMRDPDNFETLYSASDIKSLMNRFGDIKKSKTDTTLNIPWQVMDKKREKLINDLIEEMASYQVVITDRYHGTIFSAIASTPVIVVSSADHKLSSGVKWFPKDIYDGYIHYADSLESAYNIARQILARKDYTYDTPSYFKDNYWDKLRAIIN